MHTPLKLLVIFAFLCQRDCLILSRAATLNNFTLQGVQDYTPFGPTFQVGGSMLGCDLQLAAPIADVWFKSLSVDTNGNMNAIAGKF